MLLGVGGKYISPRRVIDVLMIGSLHVERSYVTHPDSSATFNPGLGMKIRGRGWI